MYNSGYRFGSRLFSTQIGGCLRQSEQTRFQRKQKTLKECLHICKKRKKTLFGRQKRKVDQIKQANDPSILSHVSIQKEKISVIIELQFFFFSSNLFEFLKSKGKKCFEKYVYLPMLIIRKLKNNPQNSFQFIFFYRPYCTYTLYN